MKGRDLKPHIGIFGRRNNGKSSLINVLVNQEVAIVSDKPGTTTDPVRKSIEIFGIGPVIIVDTAGIDDTGELGKKRVASSRQVIRQIDCAILVIAGNRFGSCEQELITDFKRFNVPYIIVYNKSDLEKISGTTRQILARLADAPMVEFSTLFPVNLGEVIEALKKTIPETSYQKDSLLGGLVNRGEVVLLITPIDSEAPDGRMILPQVMAIRDVLDQDCIALVLKETQLEHFLATSGIRPALAVTDSQVFGYVSRIIGPDTPLTGFSIIFARLKGEFSKYMEGTSALDRLKDGDRVLIMESCTHQVSCEDIGRHKIPAWISNYTGRQIIFDIAAGNQEPPAEIKSYAMVIQCGGCVMTRKQVSARIQPAIEEGIPVSNYGMVIAYMNGIFARATAPFRKEIHAETAV